MANTYHVERPDGILMLVARTAFPNYKGRTFKVEFGESVDCRSYWEGGSRDSFAAVRLNPLMVMPLPTTHPVFDPEVKGIDAVPLNPGMIIVEHSIFCGKDMGLTFHVHPDAAKLLPAPDKIDLTPDEAVVLWASRTFIPSGRHREAEAKGVGEKEYGEAKKSLIEKGLLNKAGAITPKGRNVRSTIHD